MGKVRNSGYRLGLYLGFLNFLFIITKFNFITMNKETIKTELKQYILDNYKSYPDLLEKEDLFFELFNNDYYIIGYYKAEQWLKQHNINVFEGIEFAQTYERMHFGDDAVTTYKNAEQLVNMITYIIGEELIFSGDIEELKEQYT